MPPFDFCPGAGSGEGESHPVRCPAGIDCELTPTARVPALFECIRGSATDRCAHSVRLGGHSYCGLLLIKRLAHPADDYQGLLCT